MFRNNCRLERRINSNRHGANRTNRRRSVSITAMTWNKIQTMGHSQVGSYINDFASGFKPRLPTAPRDFFVVGPGDAFDAIEETAENNVRTQGG